MDMNEIDLNQMGQAARSASRKLARASTVQKNATLYAIADALDANRTRILDANRQDVEDGKANGLNAALLDGLSLEGRLAAIAAEVRGLATLADSGAEGVEETGLPYG